MRNEQCWRVSPTRFLRKWARRCRHPRFISRRRPVVSMRGQCLTLGRN